MSRLEAQNIAKKNGLRLSIQGPPTENCKGFSNYTSSLDDWLGTCPWDIVQFNVGMWLGDVFQDGYTDMMDYTDQLTRVVEQIREHSPTAHIVFALTTPSPFDSYKTWPNKDTCPHYDKFHKVGFVQQLNDAAIATLSKFSVTINDRYSIIQPELDQYQKPCDVHYNDKGYELLAKQDLAVFTKLLGLH